METLFAHLIMTITDDQISLPNRWHHKLEQLSAQGIDTTDKDQDRIHDMIYQQLREESEIEKGDKIVANYLNIDYNS